MDNLSHVFSNVRAQIRFLHTFEMQHHKGLRQV
jgi:hypothetical protein